MERPIVADFDDRGRLYVADSSGSNANVQDQLKEKPHRIVRLEDTDGDGVFDESIVFADLLMFPEGVLWHQGAIYCGAPPEIWRLEDTDGDGVADQREVWFDAKTLTGCANDIHGPYLGKDGWIYWCKGAFAEQTNTLFNGTVIKDSAAHIFRCLPDGSEFDSVMSGGMDNPVEIAFDDSGDLFFTTTFYSHPRAGKRDALVHAIYGGVYPKEHGVLDGLTLTGEYLPAMTHLGPAAPSGLMRYESEILGEDFRGNLFSTHFNLRRIQRHQLIEKGSSFETVDSDFLVSSHYDFHPTDVLEDGDGSLLVLDTGGWYKLCCPTSQLQKPDVLGAIYRVKRQGAQKASDPFGNMISWDEISVNALIQLLGDARQALHKKAIQKLAERGRSSLPALKTLLEQGHVGTEVKQRAIWALTRMHMREATDVVRSALQSKDDPLLRTAIHSVGMRRDKESIDALAAHLGHEDAHVRRKAAEALGRIGEPRSAVSVLEQSKELTDRNHEHSLVYALIQMKAEIHDLRHALTHGKHPDVRRVALTAMSQLYPAELKVSDISPFLNAKDQELRERAIWVAGFHPEWGGGLANHFETTLSDLSDDQQALVELRRQLEVFVNQTEIQTRLGQWLSDSSISDTSKEMILNVMKHSSVRKVPETWLAPMAEVLESNTLVLVEKAIDTIGSWTLTHRERGILLPALRRVLDREGLTTWAKLSTIKAIGRFEPVLSKQQIQLTQHVYQESKESSVRDLIIDIWRDSHLKSHQLELLLGLLQYSGPLHLSQMIDLFSGQTSSELGLALMSAIREAPANASIRPDLLLHVVDSFPDEVGEEARKWLKTMEVDLEGQRRKLGEVLSKLPKGDVRRGQAIFKSDVTACSACHQVGYVGGQTGPDLTRIGSVRNEQDLLESILFPSASFVRSYEPMIVDTSDGESYSGILQREGNNQIRLVTGAGQELQWEETAVDSIRPGQVSVMPTGLGEQLSLQELADLLAFLKSRQ